MKIKLAVLTAILAFAAVGARADSINQVTADCDFFSVTGAFDIAFQWDTTTNAIVPGTLRRRRRLALYVAYSSAWVMNLDAASDARDAVQIDFSNIGDGGSFDLPGTYSDDDMDLSMPGFFMPQGMDGSVLVDPISTPEPPAWLLSLLGMLAVMVIANRFRASASSSC